MSKQSKPEVTKVSSDETFVVWAQDSRERFEQPKGKFKDLFKRMTDEANKGRNRELSNASKVLKNNSPLKPTSMPTERCTDE